MASKIYLGIEIGGTKLQLVLGNENAEILQRFRFVVDRVAGAEEIRRHIADTLKVIKPGRSFCDWHWLWRPGRYCHGENMDIAPNNWLVGFPAKGMD